MPLKQQSPNKELPRPHTTYIVLCMYVGIHLGLVKLGSVRAFACVLILVRVTSGSLHLLLRLCDSDELDKKSFIG